MRFPRKLRLDSLIQQVRVTVNRVELETGGAMLGALKVLGYVVVLLMVVAGLFAFYMSVTHWSGIGV